jgi:hypothetical protein
VYSLEKLTIETPGVTAGTNKARRELPTLSPPLAGDSRKIRLPDEKFWKR